MAPVETANAPVGHNIDMVEHALQQHENLANMLRTAGKWGAVHVHPFIIGGAGIMRKDNDWVLKTLGLGESARQSLLKELSIHSIRWTARTLEIRRPYLTSPAEFQRRPERSGARPAPKRRRGLGDGAPVYALPHCAQHKHGSPYPAHSCSTNTSCMTKRMKVRKTVTLLKRRHGRWRIYLHSEQ